MAPTSTAPTADSSFGTAPAAVVEAQIAANSEAPASAPGTGKRARNKRTASTTSCDQEAPVQEREAPAGDRETPVHDREAPATVARARPSRPASKLVLDLNAVADVDGLHQEVTVLRASIRQLASGGDDIAEHVKVLAELRHQIETLCRTLKTQQSLEGPDGDGRAAEMRRILEELGDQLEVER